VKFITHRLRWDVNFLRNQSLFRELPIRFRFPPLPGNTGNMNKNLTETAFILDRSGSMASVTEAAITGFNEYLVPLACLPVQEAVALDTAKTSSAPSAASSRNGSGSTLSFHPRCLRNSAGARGVRTTRNTTSFLSAFWNCIPRACRRISRVFMTISRLARARWIGIRNGE